MAERDVEVQSDTEPDKQAAMPTIPTVVQSIKVNQSRYMTNIGKFKGLHNFEECVAGGVAYPPPPVMSWESVFRLEAAEL